jgi:hypothetical protein
MMEMAASIASTWSGLAGHPTFTHYPKNVLRDEDFVNVIC